MKAEVRRSKPCLHLSEPPSPILMSFAARVADVLLAAPGRSELLFRVARRIVAAHRAENDSRMERNGEFRLLADYLPRAKVVFDVGANVGDWAVEALRINPHIDLHCFEPAADSFAVLQQRLGKARANLLGLGAQAGDLELQIYGSNSTVNSAYEIEGATPLRTEEVEVTTLDAYAAHLPAIDFLKIDVEGHERFVLEGARSLIAERRIKVVQFEYGPMYAQSRSLLRDIFGLLPGYRIHKIYPDRLQPVSYSAELENLQLANYLAVLS